MREVKDGIYIEDNGLLRVEVNPARGANIRSVKYKNKELLFQPPRECGLPPRGARFEDYAAAGFDDAFPNIDPEEIEYNGRKIKYNDHGDIWTSRADMRISGGAAVFCTRTDVFIFEKSVRIDKNRLTLSYSVKNVSEEVFPCFYTMHCLFECEENMRIIFETDLVENAVDSERLGGAGTVCSYPVTEDGADLSRVRKRESGKYEKFYDARPLKRGFCALVFPEKGVTAEIEWDKNVLPYLGFWVTEGGFRGDYNCAAEPSSGYYDSVSKALLGNKLWLLEPGEEKRFDITVTVKEAA